MGKLGEYAMFGLKVALAIIVINNVGPIKQIVYRDYFNSGA